MRNFFIILLLFNVSFVKAEHFLNFNIYKVDLSEYPTVKIIGGATIEILHDELFLTGKSLEIYENDNKVYFDIDIIPIEDIKMFTLTYESSLTETCVRNYLFKFDDDGVHNGGDGQTIIYNEGYINHLNDGYKYIKETSLEDVRLLTIIEDFLSDPEKGKYFEIRFLKLTREDLEHYPPKYLRIIRNEVFARNGHIFIEGGEMDKYFSKKEWYKRKKKIDLDELTEVERHNVEIIIELEQ